MNDMLPECLVKSEPMGLAYFFEHFCFGFALVCACAFFHFTFWTDECIDQFGSFAYHISKQFSKSLNSSWHAHSNLILLNSCDDFFLYFFPAFFLLIKFLLSEKILFTFIATVEPFLFAPELLT